MVHLVKVMVFPVVMYGCESWTIKKAECQRIHGFELSCQRRLLRVPWTERRSNQSILREISPEYSLKGLMLRQKLQYFGHLIWRTDSLGKTLMLGKIESRRRRGRHRMNGWMASLTQWTWVWVSPGSWWWTGEPVVWQSMGLQRVGRDWVTELNWGIENASDIDIRRKKTVPQSLLISRPYILFQLVTNNKKVLPDSLSQYIC